MPKFDGGDTQAAIAVAEKKMIKDEDKKIKMLVKKEVAPQV